MFRSVYVPAKKKPKSRDCCGRVFGCTQCRYAIQEWKRNEALRKKLAASPVNIDLILFKFCILGMAVCSAFGGLCMMQQDHNGAFKCLCGAIAWALGIFIFDRNVTGSK